MEPSDAARYFFEAGTLPFIILGTVHMLVAVGEVFRPRLLTPRDDHVREAMCATSLRLRRGWVMWPAWLGFNITHGLGLVFFGLVLLLIAVDDCRVVAALDVLMPLAVAVSVTYVVLAIRFFFNVPAVVSAVGAACFIASYVLL